MKDIFSPMRFWWLLRKTVMERPAYVFGLLGLVLGSSLLVYSFFSSLENWEAAHLVTLFLGLVGGGCYITSSLFANFSSRPGGASYLSLPASHFEKWLCTVVIVIVFFLPIFLVFYRIMDSTFVNVYHTNLDHSLPYYKYLYEKARIFSFRNDFAIAAFILFFNCTGAMLLGTLYFNKVSFIKVFILMCAAFTLTFILNFYLAKLFFHDVKFAFPFNSVGLNVDKEVGEIELPAVAILLTGFVIRYVTPVCFWALAYLRLREKEF